MKVYVAMVKSKAELFSVIGNRGILHVDKKEPDTNYVVIDIKYVRTEPRFSHDRGERYKWFRRRLAKVFGWLEERVRP